MFCKKCNAPIEEGQKFCTECGAPVEQPTNLDSFESVSKIEDTTIALPLTVQEENFGYSKDEPMPESAFEPQTQPFYQPPVGSPISPAGQPVTNNKVYSAGNQQGQSSQKKPHRKLTENKPLLIGIIAGAVVVVAAIVVAIFLLTRGPETNDVYYGSDQAVTIKRDTVVVAYSVDNQPLEHYEVILVPENAETNWKQASIKVDGTDGFNLSDIENLPDGTYRMSISDTSDEDGSSEVYNCPNVQVTSSEEEIEDVTLRPNPDDPDASKVTIEYGFNYTTTDVQIIHNDRFGSTRLNETWRYPQFSSSVEREEVNQINKSLKSNFDSTLTDTKAWSESSSYAQCTNYNQTVTNLNGSIASIRTEKNVTNWGAHGSLDVSGQIINLETGGVVSPEEALNMTSDDLHRQAASAIRSYLSSHPSDILSSSEVENAISKIVNDSSRYYLTDYGAVIVAQEYELGSFAFGGHEIAFISNNDSIPVGSEAPAES